MPVVASELCLLLGLSARKFNGADALTRIIIHLVCMQLEINVKCRFPFVLSMLD